MDDLLAARALMGVSLGFHIIYATIGVGLPFLLMLAEGISFWKKEELYHEMARRWIRPAGVLFAIGAVSGTILSFELGLLWPKFMEFSGPLIGLPFWMEGYAFFTEAIFLALYIYGEKRLSRRALFLCTIPLAIAAAISAVFVISANSWMNTPDGFVLAGRASDRYQPPGCDEQSGLGAPGGARYAGRLCRHRLRHGRHLRPGAAAAGLDALLPQSARPLPGGGHGLPPFHAGHRRLGGFLSRPARTGQAGGGGGTFRNDRPTRRCIIGGWADEATGEVSYAIEIPSLLSLLAFKDPDAEVIGLNAFPTGTRAPAPTWCTPSSI